ncbi:betaine--homocysteine S-methyltransferase 1-like [Ptychodera flava]|uniref:betaine--homocysteine S-methyltransferase 1-like n=1 Tax=Ptychodera flava TaxID=63121 RepID=UPI003969C500
MPKVKGFLERIKDGDHIIVAEGYLFLFERRGYLKAGPFVPEVILENPELVRSAYREFVHAGSDVVLAFTFYAHREKMRLIGREKDLMKINVDALRMAREVADETGTLMAGNICNTNLYCPGYPERDKEIKEMLQEQVQWAVEAGADFIVGETYFHVGEAMLALEAIKEVGNGLPFVITLGTLPAEYRDGNYITCDEVPYDQACQKLYDAGATVVGVNCGRGPETMIPILEQIRKTYKGPLAALPVPYRTTKKEPSFAMVTDPIDGERLFPLDLEVVSCSRTDIARFADQCKDLDIKYVGLCCGNQAYLTRALAERLGRKTPASRFSADMSKHCLFGTDDAVDKSNLSNVRGFIEREKKRADKM